MANALLSPKVYANAGLKVLKNNLVAARLVNTEFNDSFKQVGATVYVKRPPEFIVRTGPVVSIQDVVEGEQPVVIDQQKGIDIQFSSLEETLTVDRLLHNRSLNSAMAQLAQTVDQSIIAQFTNIPSWVGTPGLVVDSVQDFNLAPKRLDNLGVPANSRIGLLGPDDHYGLSGSFSNLYAQTGVANEALKKAALPPVSGVDLYMSQNAPVLTTGTRTNGTVNGAGQNQTYLNVKSTMTQTLILAGLGAGGTIAAGDVFTIAGVYAVNPRSKSTLNFLAQFVVTTAVTADGSGNATVTIRNPIISSGAYQTVSAAPANGAAVTWMGTANTVYNQSLVLRQDAITLATAKLFRPFSGECDYSVDPDTGIALRYWRFSDGVNDLHTHRWDILYGVTTTDARQAVRLSGS